MAEQSSVDSKRECKAESKLESNEESKLETDCEKRNNSVSPFKFYIFLTSFFGFFISKLSSLSHGILIHHQFLMLLTFIFCLLINSIYIRN